MLVRCLSLLAGSVTLISGAMAAPAPVPVLSPINCEGNYSNHLQGVCLAGRNVYWSWTDALVKTDQQGYRLKEIKVAKHHGDPCVVGGKVYVAVNLGEFNQPAGKADSWVYVYDADSLAEVGRQPLPEVVHGAGGVAYHDGKFIVVGGLPAGANENYLYEYDEAFRFQRRHVLASGATEKGIQTVDFAEDSWWFGAYGNPRRLIRADRDFKVTGDWKFDAALGIVGLGANQFLIGHNDKVKGSGYRGTLLPARFDPQKGMVVTADAPLPGAATKADLSAAPGFRIQLDTPHKGYDGETCWVHARAGAIPGATPTVVLTMQKLLLTGSDVFYALNEMRTKDLGRKWLGPIEHSETLGRRNEPNGVVVAACDFWPKWHAPSGKLLGIGHTVRYLNNKVMPVRRRETCYSVYDEKNHTWSPWTILAMPAGNKFENAGAGCVQRLDLPNGDILLPIYFKSSHGSNASVTVLRCSFDGQKLNLLEQGNELTRNSGRGLGESSLTRFQNKYYLTMRNDDAGYVATSKDGLHFDPPVLWRFDDGEDLGNYNTQQHWVTHDNALFLVYTRRGANNDHVFRHRAPLFIAQVDPRKLCVIRKTERILIPERGARLGNFGVTEVNEHETWVTVTEWMQTWGPKVIMPPDNKYGADNSVYVARILWEKPNTTWNQR